VKRGRCFADCKEAMREEEGDPMGYMESFIKADRALRSLARFMERHAKCRPMGTPMWTTDKALACAMHDSPQTWTLPAAYRRKR
jgi:hypothetical protein